MKKTCENNNTEDNIQILVKPPPQQTTTSSHHHHHHHHHMISMDDYIHSTFEQCCHHHHSTNNNNNKKPILRSDPLSPDILIRHVVTLNNNKKNNKLIIKFLPNLFNNKRSGVVPKMVNMETPFDSTKFHFNKVDNVNEILCHVQWMNNQEEQQEEEEHRILVNVSPLMYGHGLLIPWREKCLSQRLDEDVIRFGLEFLDADFVIAADAADADADDGNDAHGIEEEQKKKKKKKGFRVGFNSLGAFSSVNHLHLHILYPDAMTDDVDDNDDEKKEEWSHDKQGQKKVTTTTTSRRYGTFPIEHAPIKRILKQCVFDEKNKQEEGEYIRIDLIDWMVPSFAFSIQTACDENNNNSSHQGRGRKRSPIRNFLARTITKFVINLQKHGIPHNVLFIPADNDDNDIRVIVIPRQPQHLLDTDSCGFNAALGEICGFIVTKTLDVYHKMSSSSEDDGGGGIVLVEEFMKNHVACDDDVLEMLIRELD